MLELEKQQLTEHFNKYNDVSDVEYTHLLQGIELINQINSLL
jgi:hypothetical protein